MPGELPEVVDQLIVIQKTVVKPTGEKEIARFYDEPPARAMVYPCLVSVEQEIPHIDRTSGRRFSVVIDMSLLFASADKKYSVRRRRKWLQPVLDTFDKKLKLGGALPPVQHSPITRVSFQPVELNNQSYFGITFTIEVEVSQAFDFGA